VVAVVMVLLLLLLLAGIVLGQRRTSRRRYHTACSRHWVRLFREWRGGGREGRIRWGVTGPTRRGCGALRCAAVRCGALLAGWLADLRLHGGGRSTGMVTCGRGRGSGKLTVPTPTAVLQSRVLGDGCRPCAVTHRTKTTYYWPAPADRTWRGSITPRKSTDNLSTNQHPIGTRRKWARLARTRFLSIKIFLSEPNQTCQPYIARVPAHDFLPTDQPPPEPILRQPPLVCRLQFPSNASPCNLILGMNAPAPCSTKKKKKENPLPANVTPWPAPQGKGVYKKNEIVS
jgi:hypothetical protein